MWCDKDSTHYWRFDYEEGGQKPSWNVYQFIASKKMNGEQRNSSSPTASWKEHNPANTLIFSLTRLLS